MQNIPFTEEQIKKLSLEACRKVREEGKTLQEALELDDAYMEELYSLGHSYYGRGMYKDALNIFYMLQSLAPLSYKYQYAFGSTCYQMELYNDAVVAFSSAAHINPFDPMTFYYMGDAFHKLEMEKEATLCRETVVELCKGNEKYKGLGEQVKLLLN